MRFNPLFTLIIVALLFFYLLPVIGPIILVLVVASVVLRLFARNRPQQRQYRQWRQEEQEMNDAQWREFEAFFEELFRQQMGGQGQGAYGRQYQGAGGSRNFSSFHPASEAELLSKLGLPADATNDQIRSAYRHLVLQYHPDRFRNASPEKVKEAETRFKSLQSAYEEIKRRRGL